MTGRQRVATIALTALLAGMPALGAAQAPAPGMPPAPGTPAAPGISPAVPAPAPRPSLPPVGATPGAPGSLGGQAAPRMPMTPNDCGNGGWQRFGFTDPGACASALPAGPR